jgi:hypothetical protein
MCTCSTEHGWATGWVVVGNPKPIGALPSVGGINDSIAMSTFPAIGQVGGVSRSREDRCGRDNPAQDHLQTAVLYIPSDSLKCAAFCCDLRIVWTGNNT